MFNISFVVVTVRARMQGFPRHLEEAAMDLGANEWTTFWKVTFPLIFPGILAGAPAGVLAVDRRLHHHQLHRPAPSSTFPIWVWASIRNNLPPQIHVIGTMVFVGAVGLVALSTLYERRVGAARPTHRQRGGGPSGRGAPGGPGMTTIDRAAEPVTLPDHAVVPAGLGPHHEPRRRPRRRARG